jgi:hypothetical protein
MGRRRNAGNNSGATLGIITVDDGNSSTGISPPATQPSLQ